jgi:hypothetical protein
VSTPDPEAQERLRTAIGLFNIAMETLPPTSAYYSLERDERARREAEGQAYGDQLRELLGDCP